MTDLEKAARMALEALGYYEVAGLATTRVAKSITALRQALSNSVEQPAQQSAERGEPVAWRNAALRVGEDLCSVGPFGYYDMTAEQWLDWALSVVTVHAPPASKSWVGLTDVEIARVVSLAGFAPDWAEANIATQIVRVCQDMLKEKNIK